MIHAFVLAALAAGLDGAHIRNSGSTNAPPYEILVWSDGNARVMANGQTRSLNIGAKRARNFLDAAKRNKLKPEPGAPCDNTGAGRKNVSLGNRMVVTYHNWRSPDLVCQSGNLAILNAEVESIVRLAQPVGARRIMLPPNEPRRVPESTPAPSPTPTS